MPDKPTNPEDDYFAREDLEKKYKLAREMAAKRAKNEAEALKAAHYMKCPKCGNDLQTINVRGVEVDRCFVCHGTWLDEGELEKLAGTDEETGGKKLLSSIVNVFRPRG